MSSDRLTSQEILSLLRNPEAVQREGFSIVQSLCSLYDSEIAPSEFQDLVIRALEHRSALGSSAEILDGLVRELGLFPYLAPETLSLGDRIAYEYHRPPNMTTQDVVFHRPQAHVYRELMSGRNVILSAPTSFGKSLIIDAVIVSEKHKNILVVVPSIALIDETRRRLADYRGRYKLITHPSQTEGERNIFIYTQERALDDPRVENVTFFVIDEFYKLAPERDEGGRGALLNQLFYRLARRGRQFYMLGPSITGVSKDFRDRLEFTFLHEQYPTVASELHYVESGDDELAALRHLCESLAGPTIIFCKSPPRAAEVVSYLLANNVGRNTEHLSNAVEWIAEEFHSEWHLVAALRRGIGVHHGRIPRAIAQFVVRAFDEGRLDFLVCTSTLIEGVNTKAQNMIILDNKINRAAIDFFTFNNIRGRSGRMFEHYIGHVYVFHEPPPDELPMVDVPAFTQSEAATERLLIQLDEADLTDRSRQRLAKFREQDLLAYSVLKANVGIDPEQQIALAETIDEDIHTLGPQLNWSGLPSWEELNTACKLIWDHFDGRRLGGRSVTNAYQLATRLNQLKNAPLISSLIRRQLQYVDGPDAAVQNVLDFLRLWANFHFPRLLIALDRIQRDMLPRYGYVPGDYELYAARVENFFLDPALLALDEYGIPLQTGRRISDRLQAGGDIDRAIAQLKAMDERQLDLHPFEREMIQDAKRFL